MKMKWYNGIQKCEKGIILYHLSLLSDNQYCLSLVFLYLMYAEINKNKLKVFHKILFINSVKNILYKCQALRFMHWHSETKIFTTSFAQTSDDTNASEVGPTLICKIYIWSKLHLVFSDG